MDDLFSTTFITTIGIDFKITNLLIVSKKVKLKVWHSRQTSATSRKQHGFNRVYVFVVCIQIWDTAGEDRFRSITTSYYRGAQVGGRGVLPYAHLYTSIYETARPSLQAIAMVYAVTDRDSFERIADWVHQIEQVRHPFLFALATLHFAAAAEIYALLPSPPPCPNAQHADADVSVVLIANKCDREGRVSVSEVEGRALAAKHDIPFFMASAKHNLNVKEVFVRLLPHFSGQKSLLYI